MLQGFRNFILRGNVVDLAVAVIMGAAFGAVVDSMVKDVITPLLGALGGAPDFSALRLGPIQIGQFINAVVAFVIKAAVVYFVIVVPMRRVLGLLNHELATPPVSGEVKLLQEIRDLLQQQKDQK